MKRVHQPENNRSIVGSSYDSSDEDETRSFCYSPQDEDQRRRFCDLVALALASSRDHASVQPVSATWDGDESDSESHPSLESDAETELLDLLDEEDENESGCYVESEPSTSPSVDGSFESYDATVIQIRKLPLLGRQQRQQSFREREQAFLETDSFFTNHASLLSPDLMIIVERLLKENQRSPLDERAQDKKQDSQSRLRESKSSSQTPAHRSVSANCEKKEHWLETQDRDSRNATVMDHLRKLVYKKYESSKSNHSETESIRSSILPLSPSLLSYRDALRLSSSMHDKSSETAPESPRAKEEGTLCVETTVHLEPMSTGPTVCDLVAPSASTSADSAHPMKRRAAEASVFSDTPEPMGPGDGVINEPLQTAGESNPNLCSTNVPPTSGNVVSGVITRSMLRNSGKILLNLKSPGKFNGRRRKEPRSTELLQLEPNLPETFHTTVDHIEPAISNVKVSAGSRDNHGSSVVSVAPVAEQNDGETLVISIGTSTSISSQANPARSA